MSEWEIIKVVPPSGQHRWRWTVFGVAILVVVVAGVLAWRAWKHSTHVTEVVTVPVQGEMAVVVVLLERPVEVERATLFLTGGVVVGTATPPGRTDGLAFFVFVPGEEVEEVNIERVEVETRGGNRIAWQPD